MNSQQNSHGSSSTFLFCCWELGVVPLFLLFFLCRRTLPHRHQLRKHDQNIKIYREKEKDSRKKRKTRRRRRRKKKANGDQVGALGRVQLRRRDGRFGTKRRQENCSLRHDYNNNSRVRTNNKRLAILSFSLSLFLTHHHLPSCFSQKKEKLKK